MSEATAQQNIKYNSLIEIKTIDGVKYINKKLRLPISSRAEAEEIRQKVILQRHAFEKIHVPSSEMVYVEVMGDESGFWINIREVFAGLDFMDVVNDDNFVMYLDRLLDDIFRPLLTSTSEDYLSAGIDPTPRNFVYNNHKGEFCYVDFMPPKVFYKGKYTQEIPECPNEDFYNVRVFKHNFRPGIVYVTYVDLVREFPAQLKNIAGRLEQFFTSIKQENLYSYISNSPIYRAHDPEQVKSVIESLADWKWEKYYLLREIANWLNFMSPELTELKKQIYSVTSQERDVNSAEYGRLSNSNFQKAKELLLEGIAKLENN